MCYMSDEQIIYEPVPEFYQETQQITQGYSIETTNCIYFPCVLNDLPPQEEVNLEGLI